MREVQITLASKGFGLDQIAAASTIRHNGMDPSLYKILLDVASVSSLFNDSPAGLKLDTNTFQEILVSVCSRLIRFHPLQSPKQKSDIEAVYHIGMTIFMMTLFLQYDGQRILQYELVSLRLQDVLDRGLDDLDNDLVLWLMFIGGIWTLGGTDGLWLFSRIRTLAFRLGVNSWAEVHSCISGLPWIRALHDRPGHAVWTLACQIPGMT